MHRVRQGAVQVRSRWLLPAIVGMSLGGQMSAARAGAQAAAELKPTVAVMEFDNSAMIKRDEYDALRVGVQVMLANAIASNPRLTVVERQRIQQVLGEIQFGAGGNVDAATAAKVGKIIGVRHMLIGGFMVDQSNVMRLSVRSVNTETSAIEHVEEVTGKGDKIFKLIDQLASQVNSGLKLPGIRDPKATKESGADGPNQLEAMKAFSAAQRLEERGDYKGASAMYQKSLALNGELGSAKVRLALLDSKAR